VSTDKTPAHIKLDERNHVEKPLLNQLAGLSWEVLDLNTKQHPVDNTYLLDDTKLSSVPKGGLWVFGRKNAYAQNLKPLLENPSEYNFDLTGDMLFRTLVRMQNLRSDVVDTLGKVVLVFEIDPHVTYHDSKKEEAPFSFVSLLEGMRGGITPSPGGRNSSGPQAEL